MAENQNEIFSALQNLMEKSIKANTEFLQQSGKIFTGMLSQKLEAKDLLELNNKVMTEAVGNFIKMNIKHTENLMEFGVNVSRDIVSFIENVNKKTTGTPPSAESSQTNKPVSKQNGNGQINLKVKQGQQISTSFYLNSHNAFSQTGEFVYGDFVDVNGSKANLSMSITPKEFTLESGKSIKVDIVIGVPKDITAGKYRSGVHIDGTDTQDFDIVVDVAKSSATDANWVEDKTPKPAGSKKGTPKGKSKN